MQGTPVCNNRTCVDLLKPTWKLSTLLPIYTTKIDGVVCPPNISETVAGRLMKLVLPRQRYNSFQICFLLSILSILLRTIQRIGTDTKRKPSLPIDSADSVPSLGHPTPGSGKMLSL